ncbi:hypothetical protein TIFTF001_021976 [Ficus carica]|uniref:Uncharacterized protein n=1 Tax=Ficus carica TaxID=3494 RepID=A0AA88AT57_FICCA|nr:hypothetical protein TIFTF001_021976 [Ficus carica]
MRDEATSNKEVDELVTLVVGDGNGRRAERENPLSPLFLLCSSVFLHSLAGNHDTNGDGAGNRMVEDRAGIAIISIDVVTDLAVEIMIRGPDRSSRSHGRCCRSLCRCVHLFIAAVIARKIVSPHCNREENRWKLRPSAV